MQASIERMEDVLALRVHASGGLGDPYTWSCVIKPDDDVAVIHLAGRAPTHEERRAITKALKEYGFRAARWERRKVGVSPRWTKELK